MERLISFELWHNLIEQFNKANQDNKLLMKAVKKKVKQNDVAGRKQIIKFKGTNCKTLRVVAASATQGK